MAILKQRQINGYTLYESKYQSKTKEPRHTHSLPAISFVLAGRYLESLGGTTAARQPATLILHPPEESHAVSYEGDVRILKVAFDLTKFAELREQSITLDEPSICRSETILWLGNRIHREFRQMDSFSGLTIEGLILELLAGASRSRVGGSEKNVPRWLNDAKDFLHDNFAEPFVLQDVVKVSGVHTVHLSRVFREKFGCTIGEYVRRRRVEFAARQISLTDAPLGEIAYNAGFADHSHLNRTFKSFYGMTPNQYRQASRRS